MVLSADEWLLVEAASGGDVAAFEVLVHRNQRRVYRVALRMLGSEADAEDAAQEALLAAWLALPDFRGESAFSTWLYRIVTNECLRVLAARRVWEPLSERLEERGVGPQQRAEVRERLAAVAAGILALTPEQRAPLVLRELEGLSYEEIAQVLGVTVEAVKGRLHRARLSLWEATR